MVGHTGLGLLCCILSSRMECLQKNEAKDTSISSINSNIFCTWDTSFVSQNVFCSLLIVFICLLFFLNCFGGGKNPNAALFVECLNAWKLRMGGPRPNQLGGSGSRSASNLLDFYMQKQQELHRQKSKQGGKGKSKQSFLYKKEDDPWKITDEVNDIRNQQRVGWISLVFLSFGWNIKVVLQIQMQRCF